MKPFRDSEILGDFSALIFQHCDSPTSFDTPVRPCSWLDSRCSCPEPCYGGGGRIRTFEGRAGRFTVCSRWPLGYPSDETAHSSNFRSQVSNRALFLNS